MFVELCRACCHTYIHYYKFVLWIPDQVNRVIIIIMHGTDVHRATPLCVEYIPICLDITYGAFAASIDSPAEFCTYSLQGLCMASIMLTVSKQFTLIFKDTLCAHNAEEFVKQTVVVHHCLGCIVGIPLDDMDQFWV